MNNSNPPNDNELIEKVLKESCSESFSTLCRLYENIFFKICQRYSSVLMNAGIPISDILDEKNYIIWFCAAKFDKTRGVKFSTLIGNYARYLCLKSISARKATVNFSDEEVKTLIEDSQSKNGFDEEQNKINAEGVARYFSNIKNPRHKKIIELRYFREESPVTWKKIANEMDISVPTAISLHSKALKSLKNKIKSPEKL